MPRFLASKQIGAQAESAVEGIFKRCGMDAEAAGKNIEYDFKHTKPCEFASEVKFDIYAAKSGNIAIEYFNPKKNKASGLSATKADLWFHSITNPLSVWVTTVNQLKAYVENNTPHRIIDKGGDKNASLYLYRQDKIFTDIFMRIDNLDDTAAAELLYSLLRNCGKTW